jgi:hypothetical protein
MANEAHTCFTGIGVMTSVLLFAIVSGSLIADKRMSISSDASCGVRKR